MWKVMLADDEQSVRTALQKLIDWEKLNCQVVYVANNGTDVLQHLEEFLPDILVTDIKMPGADGMEVIRQIREEGRGISVILLTAYAEFEYARQAMRYQVSEYIVKTSVLEDLPEAVRRICARLEERERQVSLRDRQDFLRSLLKESRDMAQGRDGNFELLLQEYAQKEIFQLVLLHDVSGRLAPLLDNAFAALPHTVFSLDAPETGILLHGELPSAGELSEICEGLVSLSSGFYRTTALFGISDVFRDISLLHAAYASCRVLTDELFYEDTRPVLFAGEHHRHKGLPANLFASIDGIMEPLSHKDADGAGKAMGAFFADCEKESINTIKSAGIFLLAECVQLVMEKNPSFPRTFIDVTFQDSIYGCRSITEFRGLVEELLAQVEDILSAQEQDVDLLVRQVNDYIDVRYASQITLGNLAEALHMNKSYLSRIYKERTGKNIFDVINAKRLEKAKRLIGEGDLRLNEIALQVGFDDPAYFSRFFKKNTGLSPKEYKQKNGKREE